MCLSASGQAQCSGRFVCAARGVGSIRSLLDRHSVVAGVCVCCEGRRVNQVPSGQAQCSGRWACAPSDVGSFRSLLDRHSVVEGGRVLRGT